MQSRTEEQTFSLRSHTQQISIGIVTVSSRLAARIQESDTVSSDSAHMISESTNTMIVSTADSADRESDSETGSNTLIRLRLCVTVCALSLCDRERMNSTLRSQTLCESL